MLGYYNYTVILTYIGAASGIYGIIATLSRQSPRLGVLCLMLSGLCDMFDGTVARTRQRTDDEKRFGIQIDSLSDLVAFGVLPACIGTALIRVSPFLTRILEGAPVPWKLASERILLHAVLVLYVLPAMIRLAYYNVTEEDRQQTEGGVRKCYLGLPVTASALIFPLVLMLQYITKADITVAYLAAALLVGVLFISPIQVRKPGMRGVMTLVAVGAVEFLLMLLWKILIK